MSFASLRRLDYVAGHQNSTTPGLSQLPASILDALIPGYSVISRYLLDIFGFDISIIVSVCVLTVGVTTGLRYLHRHAWATFLKYFTASVVIEPYDIIYDNLITWTQDQEDLKRVRSLKVQSADYTDDIDELKGNGNAKEGAIFNFKNWTAKIAPRYEPDQGYHWFRHGGRWFKLSRERHQVARGWMGMMVTEELLVKLTVLGRSTEPIKELILESRDRQLSKQTARTTVRRPSPKEQRGRGRQAWIKVAVRPSRPMTTVVLENKQKAAMLRDINDFLDPATCQWYANRGLAYRRGYLLSGPPGTGKTSLSFALAGVFGLDIYCMSLSEKTLTEEDLIMLFNSLPKRCIVLLEDIDSAGVTRKKTESEDSEAEEKKKADKKDGGDSKDDDKEITKSFIEQTVKKAIKDAGRSSSSSDRSGNSNDAGITMSGLLNAIDGVASQEGRVLIMTTNHPERLDNALTRPGRVDMKIEFTLASQEQIRELFVRMYCIDSRAAARMPTNLKEIMPDFVDLGSPASRPAITDSPGKNPSKIDTFLNPTLKGLMSPPLTPLSLDSPAVTSRRTSFLEGADVGGGPSDELLEMAEKFASLLPEAVFSPAEVQGFLIMRKKDPHAALDEVEAWRDAEMTRKEENKAKEADEAADKKSPKGDESDKNSTTSEHSAENNDPVETIKITGTDTNDRREQSQSHANGDGGEGTNPGERSQVNAESERDDSGLDTTTNVAASSALDNQASNDNDETSSSSSRSSSPDSTADAAGYDSGSEIESGSEGSESSESDDKSSASECSDDSE